VCDSVYDLQAPARIEIILKVHIILSCNKDVYGYGHEHGHEHDTRYGDTKFPKKLWHDTMEI
jgi:hypothetical protein